MAGGLPRPSGNSLGMIPMGRAGVFPTCLGMRISFDLRGLSVGQMCHVCSSYPTVTYSACLEKAMGDVFKNERIDTTSQGGVRFTRSVGSGRMATMLSRFRFRKRR